MQCERPSAAANQPRAEPPARPRAVRILLVRLSSLGDVIQTFPAVTDLRRALPDAPLDWAVEESYAPLVRMHPGVTRAIPIAFRRRRRELYRLRTWRDFATLRGTLRQQTYDAVLDMQGLMKSALIAHMARGPMHGFGPNTAREPVVARFYDAIYEFAPEMHKIERYRSLASQALGYVPERLIDYGIVVPPAPLQAPSGPYCVLLHSTARPEKLWDEKAWLALARALADRGLACVLPWGDESELLRARRLGADLRNAVVPPRLSIEEAAALIGNAAAVVGVDTGLMHLAAALRVPVVGVFCNSDPRELQPLGAGPTAYRGAAGRPPSVDEVLEALAEVAPALG
jgi:heptosyltransferase I